MTQKLGGLGEQIAADFLQKNGYKILERNFLIRGGEVDIIAIDKDVLVFIEVKTRSSNAFGTPAEAITYFKLKSIIKTAQFFVLSYPNLPKQLRIDAVSVSFDLTGKPIIEHIKNISQ